MKGPGTEPLGNVLNLCLDLVAGITFANGITYQRQCIIGEKGLLQFLFQMILLNVINFPVSYVLIF